MLESNLAEQKAYFFGPLTVVDKAEFTPTPPHFPQLISTLQAVSVLVNLSLLTRLLPARLHCGAIHISPT